MFLLHAFQAFVDLVGSWLTGRRLRQLAYAMPLALGIAALVLFVPSHFASAGVGDFVYETLGHFLYWLTNFLAKFLTQLIILVVNVAAYNDFIDSTAVTTAWVVVRDLFNMILVLLVLYSSISTILGVNSNFQWSSQLPKLVFAAIAVNFSKTMAGLIIDAGQVMMLTFVNAFKDVAAGNLLNALGLDAMVSLDPSAYASGTLQAGFADLAGVFLLAVIALIIAIFVVASLLLFFIERIAWLWFLVATSPVAFLDVASPVKALAGLSSQWWNAFISKVFSGIGIAFTLWLAFAVMQAAPGESVQIQSTKDAQSIANVGEISVFAKPQKLLSFAMGIVLLYMALNLAKSAGSLAGSVAGKGADFLQNAGKRTLAGAKAVSGIGIAQRVWSDRQAIKDAAKKESMDRRTKSVGLAVGNFENQIKSATIGKAQSTLTRGTEYIAARGGKAGAIVGGAGTWAVNAAADAAGVDTGARFAESLENRQKDAVKKTVEGFKDIKDDGAFRAKFDEDRFKGTRDQQIAFHAEAIKRGVLNVEERNAALNFISKHGDDKTKEFFAETVRESDPEAAETVFKPKTFESDENYDIDTKLKKNITLKEDYDVREDFTDATGTAYKRGQTILAGTVLPKDTLIAKGSLKIDGNGYVAKAGNTKRNPKGEELVPGAAPLLYQEDARFKKEQEIKKDVKLAHDYPVNAEMTLTQNVQVRDAAAPGGVRTVLAGTPIPKGSVIPSGETIFAKTVIPAGQVAFDANTGYVQKAGNQVIDSSGEKVSTNTVDYGAIIKSFIKDKGVGAKAKHISKDLLMMLAGEEDVSAEAMATAALTVLKDKGSNLKKNVELLREALKKMDATKRDNTISLLTKDKEGRATINTMTGEDIPTAIADLAAKKGGKDESLARAELYEKIQYYASTTFNIGKDIVDLGDADVLNTVFKKGNVDKKMLVKFSEQINADPTLLSEIKERLFKKDSTDKIAAERMASQLERFLNDNSFEPAQKALLANLIEAL